MEEPLAGLPLHHIALRVADCSASLAFYGGLLGWREVRRRDGDQGIEAIWLQNGATVLMLERELRGRGPGGGSGHLLAFAVDALGYWEQRLTQEGIVIDDRTAHTLYFRDPDGHRLGLTTFPLPA